MATITREFGQIYEGVTDEEIALAFRNNNLPQIGIKSVLFTCIYGRFYGSRPDGPKHVLCTLMTDEKVGGMGLATCSDYDEFIPSRGQRIALMRAMRDAQRAIKALRDWQGASIE